MRRSLPLLVLAAAILLALVISVVTLVHRPTEPASGTPPPASQDQEAYLPALTVSDPHMSAAQNFLGHTITYLDARLSNNGTRTVGEVAIQMEFHDELGQVVLRENAHPVSRRLPPLQPGQTRSFRVSFDHIPIDWNQTPPAIVVKSVSF